MTHEIEVIAEDSKISVTVAILEAVATGDRSRKKNPIKTGTSKARKKTTWMTMRICQRLSGIQSLIVGLVEFHQVARREMDVQIMNMQTVAAEMAIESNNIETKNSKTTRIIE